MHWSQTSSEGNECDEDDIGDVDELGVDDDDGDKFGGDFNENSIKGCHHCCTKCT